MKTYVFISIVSIQTLAILGLAIWNLQEDRAIENNSLLKKGNYFEDNARLDSNMQQKTPPVQKQERTTAETTASHDALRQQIESAAGMALSPLAKRIREDEGDRPRPYLDTSGAATIGVGRNLSGNGVSVTEFFAIVPERIRNYRAILTHADIRTGRIYIHKLELAQKLFPNPLTHADIELLLLDDLQHVLTETEKLFGVDTWTKLDNVRKTVLIDLVYNLGIAGFKQFHKFIAAVKAEDWQTAAAELLLSKAARENVLRYHRNATVLQTGDASYFTK